MCTKQTILTSARRRRQVINGSSVLNVNIEHIRLKIQLIKYFNAAFKHVSTCWVIGLLEWL